MKFINLKSNYLAANNINYITSVNNKVIIFYTNSHGNNDKNLAFSKRYYQKFKLNFPKILKEKFPLTMIIFIHM